MRPTKRCIGSPLPWLAALALVGCRPDTVLPPADVAPSPYVAAAIRCEVRVATSHVACGAGTTVSGLDARSAHDEARRHRASLPEASGEGTAIGPMRLEQVTGGGAGIRFEADAFTRRGGRIELGLRLRNLLPVALGVQAAGATTTDTTEVFVVLPTAPVVTGGSGALSLQDARFGTVAGLANVDFLTYDGPIVPNAASRPRLWSFQADAGVTAFTFDFVVLAQVRENPLPVLGSSAVSSLAMYAGERTACAVRGAAGTLFCWGESNFLTAGTATSADPVARPFDAVRFEQVAGNGETICGVTETGAIWCWGALAATYNATTTLAPWRPVPMLGNRQYTAVTVGASHACGLAADSTAWCAGDNAQGQLGSSTVGDFAFGTAPVRVAGPWRFISLDAGDEHTCGVHVDGSLVCWGSNGAGQLGDGTFVRRPIPTPVQGATRFTRVSAGAAHTCAVSSIGEAWCWGSASFYQLGDGSDVTDPVPSPQRVLNSAFGGTVEQVSAGFDHSCAITTSQQLFCWGSNSEGKLGRDPSVTGFTLAPVQVGTLAGVRQVEASGRFTCAVVIGSVLQCWGANLDGELGSGAISPSGWIFDPNTIVVQPQGNGVTVPPPSAGVSRFALGSAGGCAIATNAENQAPRTMLCWGGGGFFGRMVRGVDPGGLAGTAPRGIPTRVRFASVAIGEAHACALTPAGEAWCWGDNQFGQIGNGSTTTTAPPVPVSTGVRFAELALGQDHSCGRTAAGAVWCWGRNNWGQFGDGGVLSQSAVPVQVPTGGIAFTQLVSGWQHLCALDAGGVLYCWGQNGDGEALGGSATFVGTVTAYTGIQRFSTIAAGERTSCAIAQVTGATWCWGENSFGQLGVPANNVANPVPVAANGVPPATAISTGATTCVSTAAGSVWCWGANFGNIVDPANQSFAIEQPTRVNAPVALFGPRIGVDAACARDIVGDVWCWGNAVSAGVGDLVGTTAPRRLLLP